MATSTGDLAAPAAAQSSEREWLLAVFLRNVSERFQAGWALLPREAGRVWVSSMLVGFVVAALATVALTLAMRHQLGESYYAWERAFLPWFEQASPISFKAALWLDLPGHALASWTLILTMAGAWAWAGRPLRALCALVGFFLLELLVGLGWILWNRQRPNLIAEGTVVPDFLNSFPSGHVTQATFIYGLLAYYVVAASPRAAERWLAVLLALGTVVLVGAGRLRIGAHWPSDVVGALIIGGLWLGFCVLAVQRAEERAARLLPDHYVQ